MPFDATNYADNEVSASGVEVGKLRRLSEALKGEMPGWRWDYMILTNNFAHPACGTAGCAIGMAYSMKLLTGAIDQEVPWTTPFGIAEDEADDLFGNPLFYGRGSFSEIRPGDVADAIDRIIARETA